MQILTKKIVAILMLFLVMFSASELKAVPAYPGLIHFTQPNGEMLSIYLQGDEVVSWAKTLDGYSLMHNKAGYFEYATRNNDGNMIPSGIVASEIDKRTALETEFLSSVNKGLFYSDEQMNSLSQIRDIYQKEYSKDFPTTGARKLVCILMGFSDLAFTLTQENFNDLFNQVGYSLDGATGSVNDYFKEVSYYSPDPLSGLDLTVTVAGPYTAPQNMAYYGNNTNGNARALVTSAVNLANPDINYAEFDNDNDGSVDAVYVIFAGYGEEAGGPADAIWSHASSINTVTLDGKTISRYSCSPEFRGNSGTNITRIGVVCHEFGHVLGARDYYDTNYETGGQYDGTGDWDLQAGGSWNNSGATPAHPNGYTKCYVYNWATPIIINTQQALSLINAEQNKTNVFYRYNTPTANEYFLMENRQQIGFDAAIPGHGLIIYHVDATYIANNGYAINAGSHQGMYPMAANATTSNGVMLSGASTINTPGCPWPGTTMKATFSDATIPNSKSWALANTSKPLINISENVGAIDLCFIACGGVGDPQTLTSTTIGSSQIFLSWVKSVYGDDVMLAFNSSNTFGTPSGAYNAGDPIVDGGTVLYIGDLTFFKHVGLDPNTQYFYKAWSALSGDTYSAGITSNATTTTSGCAALNYSAAMVQNVPGVYTDLGTNGTEIETTNYDDWNSNAIDIGFSFKFNCEEFDQFILNSNGFIKLGSTPPSSAALFFTTEEQPPQGGIFYSTDPADINFISPFNYNLIGGVSPEYRVYTEGEAPNRICTIQYKNLSDKPTVSATQYLLINFQIKLYETSNVIEFVYGDWTPSTSASFAKFSGVGLKGSSNSNEDLLVGVKGSTGAWSVTTFQNAIYDGNAVNFGNQVGTNRPKPDVGRTYRFMPKFDNNLTLRQVYAMGEASTDFGNPQAISANIMNTGYFTLKNTTVSLDVSGANSFSHVKNIFSLSSGQDTTVIFDPFTATTIGITSINVSIPSDDNENDNIGLWEQNTTLGTFNYCSPTDPQVNSFNNQANHKFMAKYRVNGSAKVQSVKAYIALNAVVGSAVYGVVSTNIATGAVVAQSPSYTIQAHDLGTWRTFMLSTQPVVTNIDFLVGVNVITANAGITAFTSEYPVRANTYYVQTTAAPAPASSKIMVGATLIPLISGVEDVLENRTAIYPNPSSGVFNIVVEGSCMVNVVDITGRTILTKQVNSNNKTIDLTNFGKGIYLVKLISGNDVAVKKVIVE
jgi:M6 family metalloprotease-like protein